LDPTIGIGLSNNGSDQPLERRRAFNRKLLLWIHTAAALSSALIYLSRISVGATFWFATGGTAAILLASPVLVPYLVSAVYSSSVVTGIRWRVYTFIVILLLGTVLVDLAVSGVFGAFEQPMIFLGMLGAQLMTYVWSASFLLDVV